jgi:hypothetical protein
MSRKHLPATLLVSIGLLGRLRRRALGSHGSNDILKAADAPREAVDAGDHQHVTVSQEIEHCARFLAVHRAERIAVQSSRFRAAT